MYRCLDIGVPGYLHRLTHVLLYNGTMYLNIYLPEHMWSVWSNASRLNNSSNEVIHRYRNLDILFASALILEIYAPKLHPPLQCRAYTHILPLPTSHYTSTPHLHPTTYIPPATHPHNKLHFTLHCTPPATPHSIEPTPHFLQTISSPTNPVR